MPKTLFKVGILFAAILLIPMVGGAAQVAGVTDTEVVVGWTTPLSGPAALWGVTGLGGKAWADYINDQGGIHGRKIKVMLKDDGYNPARALANLQEMKGKIFAVCGLLGTAILNVSKDFFPENNVPLITAYGDVRIWARLPREKLKYIFIAYPDYEDEAQYLTAYSIKKLGAKTVIKTTTTVKWRWPASKKVSPHPAARPNWLVRFLTGSPSAHWRPMRLNSKKPEPTRSLCTPHHSTVP
jgi:ABC-type branched-subunit amino acid transport system substrate-binding protein